MISVQYDEASDVGNAQTRGYPHIVTIHEAILLFHYFDKPGNAGNRAGTSPGLSRGRGCLFHQFGATTSPLQSK